MKKGLEVEAKFLCPEGIAPEAITALLKAQGLRVEWRPAQLQRDVYLDTPEGTLLKGEGALRVREVNGRWVGTYKGLTSKEQAVFSRKEIEWQLTSEEVERFQRGQELVLAPKVRLPQELDIRRLKPVLTVETQRRKAVFMDAQGFQAELALDETIFKGPRGAAKHRELELELKQGSSERLRAIAKELQKRFNLESSQKSKFAVGMEKVG